MADLGWDAMEADETAAAAVAENGASAGLSPQHRTAVVQRLHRALLSGELLPRGVLSADTKLSGTVLGPVLADLVARGVVLRQNASQPGVRGPKPRYQLAQTVGRALAVGFGHDGCGVAVTDLSASTILDEADLFSNDSPPGWVDRDPTLAIATAAELARQALEATGTTGDRLVGIGISMPAPLLADGRPYGGFMDAWQSRNVAAELRRQLELPERLPVVIENDANLIALREHRRGAARGASHACVVKWGSGVGAGFLFDGRLYGGARGLAGEIGHVTTTPGTGDIQDETVELFELIDDKIKECKRCGQPCLEALLSTSSLLAYFREKLKRAGRQPALQNIADAIAQANDGDDLLRDGFRRAAHLLGHKLGPILSALNIQLLVIDSFEDPSAFPLIVDGLSEGLEHRMTTAANEQLVAEPAICGKTAAILGAADRVLEKHLGDWVRNLPFDSSVTVGAGPAVTTQSASGNRD